MTENKRFLNNGSMIFDNRTPLTTTETVDLLNELAEENKDLEEARSYYQENFLTMKTERNQLKQENKELKSILQDMGLIMSNEEVRNVRDEIASKLIKPVCKGNGFDVDVNTENGFTIIPKEDFE